MSQVRRGLFTSHILVAGACLLLLMAAGGAAGQTTSARQAIPPDAVITLERGACFGTCPIYRLTVYASGKVVFVGKNFVKKKGTVKGKITQAQLKELLAEFDKANYFALRDSYESEADGCASVYTDQPYVKTSLTLNGKTKNISHYHGCRAKPGDKALDGVFPSSLTELEHKIDEIVRTKRWIE